jgi:glycerophosphoryl diester phosphodiesterase
MVSSMPMQANFIAHRLGRAYGPDSSAAALAGALAGPLEGLETDLVLTADGELVLLHDPLLPLATTLDGWAHERTAAEIVAGRLLDQAGEPTEEWPLRLSELLAAAPAELTLQLEVKAHADEGLALRTTEAICAQVRRAGAADRVELISFYSDACGLAAARGLSSRLIVWADYEPEVLAGWAARTGVAGVSIEHSLLSERLVGALRLAGLSVNTGTVNEALVLERVLAFGPDAVVTDRPHELRAEAERRVALIEGGREAQESPAPLS